MGILSSGGGAQRAAYRRRLKLRYLLRWAGLGSDSDGALLHAHTLDNSKRQPLVIPAVSHSLSRCQLITLLSINNIYFLSMDNIYKLALTLYLQRIHSQFYVASKSTGKVHF